MLLAEPAHRVKNTVKWKRTISKYTLECPYSLFFSVYLILYCIHFLLFIFTNTLKGMFSSVDVKKTKTNQREYVDYSQTKPRCFSHFLLLQHFQAFPV